MRDFFYYSRRQRYKYRSVVERPQQCSHQQLELAEGITPPRFTSAESFSSCCDSVAVLALFFDSVAALALASCNEHVAEANVSRPHPPTPRVLCTVPTQSSRGRRNNLIFSFGKHARTAPAFPCSRANLPHGVSYNFPPPRPFSPACSPPPSCFFARDYTPADGPVRLSDGHQVLRGVLRRARHWRQRRVL